VVAGLPAELPRFQHKRQLGEMTERSIRSDDDANDAWRVASAAAMSDSRSANDSSMLDVDMDDT